MRGYLLDKEGIFECKQSGQGVGAGNGIFCVDDIKSGTMLPYYAYAFSEDDDKNPYNEPEENGKRKINNVTRDRTYVMCADYFTKNMNERTMKDVSLDGNPYLKEISCLEPYKTFACQINEASKGYKPNCLFTGNPSIRRKDIKNSLNDRKAIPIIYVVIPHDLKKGTELLTTYGNQYGDREYTPCKMKRNEVREMVDKCYEYVEHT
jgi:hypothetical protein